jgi:hypothetical protein
MRVCMENLFEKISDKNLLQKLFIIGFSCFIFEVIVFDSMLRRVPCLENVFVLLRFFSYSLIVFKGCVDFICGRYSIKEIIGFGTIGLIFLLVTYYSHHNDFLIYLAFIAAGHDIDYKIIIRCALYAHLFGLFAILISCGFYIIPNNINIRANGTIRYGLGFNFGGLLAHFILYTILLLIYYRKEDIRAIEIFFLIIINGIVFYKTNTKNPFALGCVVLFGTMMLRYIDVLRNFNGAYKTIALLIVPVTVGTIFLLSYKYDPEIKWMKMLNTLFTNRLALGHEAFSRLQIKMFGQPIEWNLKRGQYFYVDSSYMKILFSYGISTFLIFIIGMFLVAMQICKYEDVWLLLVFGIIAVHSMFDDQLPWIGSNTFMVCYSYFKLHENE